MVLLKVFLDQMLPIAEEGKLILLTKLGLNQWAVVWCFIKFFILHHYNILFVLLLENDLTYVPANKISSPGKCTMFILAVCKPLTHLPKFTCNSIWEALVGINLEISIYVGSLWARLLYGQSFSSLILYFITINEISKASFYVPKWEAEDKGNVIVRRSLSSSETLIIWYFTFLKQISFFLL